MHPNNKNESGSAIVAVLLVVAVITIIAIGLMVQQRIDIRRTQQIQTANQAYRYSQAVLYWAAGAILSSVDAPPPAEGTVWQSDFPLTNIAGHRGQTSGHLERLDQRINMNSFTDQTSTTQKASSTTDQSDLATLVNKNNPAITVDEVTQIIQNISQWISTNASKNDSYYLSLTPPYRAAHMPMVSPSELRLVVGVDAKMDGELQPFIITLPTTDAKNKDYYLLKTEVALDDQNLRVYSILHLDSNSVVKVLWSTLGTW